MDNPEYNIELGQGYVTTVDLHTFQRLKLDRHKWKSQVHPGGYVYVVAYLGTTIYLHRLLVGAQRGEHVGHRDGNTLNNRDDNLRRCTPGQNRANSRRERNNVSGLKGVTWSASSRKWMAQIVVAGKKEYLGVWVDKHRAARAYDKAARKAHGAFAGVNFPDENTGAPERP